MTCADIRDDTAWFYYPFGPGSVPPPNPAVTGILIVAVDGGASGDKFGFVPVLAGANAACSQEAPSVTPAKATAVPVTSGATTVDDRG